MLCLTLDEIPAAGSSRSASSWLMGVSFVSGLLSFSAVTERRQESLCFFLSSPPPLAELMSSRRVLLLLLEHADCSLMTLNCTIGP